VVEARKGYETVYWGKMTVNFRPQAFRKERVQEAVGYAGRAFPEVLDLVPDFSVMMLNKGPEGDTKTVLMLGDEREAGEGLPARRARGWKPRRAAVGDLLAHPVAE